MHPRPYILSELSWPEVKETNCQVAVLPWGATEAHNYHLPYGTDTLQTDYIAAESARYAWEEGTRAVVLPALPYGVQTGQRDIPFCINVNPSTQLMLLRDICRSLEGCTDRLVLLNGHGGNDFRAIVRELQGEQRLFLCTVDWWKVADARAHFTEPGDHAGELETSVMLRVAPELVRSLDVAGPGVERRSKLTALREGWAWTPRRWTAVTADTGIGNPAAATAKRGTAFADAVCARIGSFLVELGAADLNALYE